MPKKTKPISRSSADLPTPPPSFGGKAGERVSFTTLEQLCAAVAEPIDCTFELQGRMVSIPVHRLKPSYTDQIESVRRAAPTPPLIKGRTQAEDRYDTDNPQYRDGVIKANKLARGLTVYFGCPLFNKAKPGLTKGDEILAFVEDPKAGVGTEAEATSPGMTNTILELIYLAITGEGIRVREEVNQRVNF